MDKVILDIDKETKDIYLNILRGLLETQEKWVNVQYSYKEFQSPHISDDSEIFFKTCTSLGDFDSSQIDIYNKSSLIYTLELSFWDFKTRKLLKRLKRFMDVKDKWKKARDTDEILRKSLGANLDRSLKLSKIKKKLE